MQRTVLKTLKEINKWFVFPYPIISFDTETTSLDFLTQELVGISFSIDHQVCYIDIIDNPEKENILIFLRNLFEQEFKFLVAQNISYDLKVLSKYGIKPSDDCKFFDTQIAAHLLNENEPKNLDFLVKKYFHINLKKWVEIVTHGYHSQAFYSYGQDDAYYTYQLFKIQHPLLKLENLDDLFFNIEMPFQKVKVDLETNGILIDKEKLNYLQSELKQILWNLKIDMCKSANLGYFEQGQFNFVGGNNELITDINFNSSQQLVELITKKLKLKISEKTDTGNPSVSVSSLETLKGQHPFIDFLRTYKKATKLATSFVEPFSDFIDSDGRIRCNYHNTIAVTGRIITTKPNLLQLPRKEDSLALPFEFRSCFVAPKGKKIVVADYSGQELCWLAEVTQDQNLIAAIKAGKDLHLTTANIIFKLSIPDECLYVENPDYPKFKKKYKKQRYIGKIGVNFPLIYGKTAFGVAKDCDISKEKAQGWLECFFSLYPDVKKFIACCHNTIDEVGEVVDWFGRKRRFDIKDVIDNVKHRAHRQGFNFLIQSPSASQIKKAASDIKWMIDGLYDHKETKIILLVYDEIVLECLEEHASVVSNICRKKMEEAIITSVPFTVSTGVGDNYASAKV